MSLAHRRAISTDSENGVRTELSAAILPSDLQSNEPLQISQRINPCYWQGLFLGGFIFCALLSITSSILRSNSGFIVLDHDFTPIITDLKSGPKRTHKSTETGGMTHIRINRGIPKQH